MLISGTLLAAFSSIVYSMYSKADSAVNNNERWY